MAEWSIASVLKTEVRKRTGGSNPSLSALKSVGASLVGAPTDFIEKTGPSQPTVGGSPQFSFPFSDP